MVLLIAELPKDNQDIREKLLADAASLLRASTETQPESFILPEGVWQLRVEYGMHDVSKLVMLIHDAGLSSQCLFFDSDSWIETSPPMKAMASLEEARKGRQHLDELSKGISHDEGA